MKIEVSKLKSFLLWFHKNVFLKYLQFRYKTTLMTLARLTLIVLAKEVVVPILYWICVLINAIWENSKFYNILEAIKIACIPATTEMVIAILAVVVLLIVAVYEYKSDKRKVDILTDIYIPYTDELLVYLNAESYHEWTYYLAIDGNTVISEQQIDRLEKMVRYIKSRVKHEEFSRIDELYNNLAAVATDILWIFCQYGEYRKNEMIKIHRFYKDAVYNPNYHEDLQKYENVVGLISDLVFEQTRICNLILKKIRQIHPDYQVNLGVLLTDTIVSHNIYRKEEEETVQYPGLKVFMVEREKRSYHLGSGTFDI